MLAGVRHIMSQAVLLLTYKRLYTTTETGFTLLHILQLWILTRSYSKFFLIPPPFPFAHNSQHLWILTASAWGLLCAWRLTDHGRVYLFAFYWHRISFEQHFRYPKQAVWIHPTMDTRDRETLDHYFSFLQVSISSVFQVSSSFIHFQVF